MSSQCVGPGASHMSKLDSNNSLPIHHHNESMPAVGNQYLAEMLLLEAKMPSNFTTSVNYMLFTIAEFTDNKTLTCRILIKVVARFLKPLRFITQLAWTTCFFRIVEFTDNKILIGRILILIDIPKILDIHYKSVVYLSINYSHQNACILRVPPTSPWLPILLIHVGSEDKVINWKHLPKINISKYFKNLSMRHTCWGCLMWCINMKWIQQVF